MIQKKNYPIFNSKTDTRRKTVRLLLVENGNNAHYTWNGNNAHYTFVKNMSKLFFSTHNKHNKALHICDNCLKPCHSAKCLSDHLMLGCEDHQPAKLVLPEKGKNDKVLFQNIHKQIEKPFIMVGDIESYLTLEKESVKGSYQHHKVAGLSYAVIDRSNGFKKPELKIFDNAMDFLKSAIHDSGRICKHMKDSCNPESGVMKEKIINAEYRKQYDEANQCYLCRKKFFSEEEELYENRESHKVGDHDHLTGEYRGAAHSKCNLKCRNDGYNVDFFFHNGKGYDYHHVLNTVGELSKEMNLKINCIPMNSEKYVIYPQGTP